MTKALVVYPLNAGQSRVLRIVAEGGKIKSRRFFPFERKYRLEDLTGHEYSANVPEGTVAALTDHQLLRAVRLDEGADNIDFFISKRGKKALADKTVIPVDANQLDLIHE